MVIFTQFSNEETVVGNESYEDVDITRTSDTSKVVRTKAVCNKVPETTHSILKPKS